MYPWQVSTSGRDTFRFYGRAGVVGWTIEIARNGVNRANTGFAVAEVDDTNNEYLYEVTWTAAAVSDTGVYDITVYETADDSNSWSFSVKVTDDGTMGGATGDVSWTSSSGDGRVTDGSDALGTATVQLLDTDNNVLQEAESDASGLYTLLLSDDSTYNLNVRKSGYVNQRAETALVVTSNTVTTSVGADIALSAASTSTEAVTFAELLAYYKRQALNTTSSQGTTEAKEGVNMALRWLAGEFKWPHLDEEYQICLRAKYNTGTVAISSGSATVTGTGTTFPSWADDAFLYLGGTRDIFLEVESRNSDTELTLANTYDAASLTGETYELLYTRYAKPSGLLSIRRFLGSSASQFKPVSQIRMAELRNSRSAVPRGVGFYYSISDSCIEVWPPVNTDKVYKYIGCRRPTTLVDDADVADWDVSLLGVLHHAIDYEVARRGSCRAGNADECLGRRHLAVQNAMGAMQDHSDMEYGSNYNYADEFDGDIT